MQARPRNGAKHISKCLQLAVLLEASAEKPGNVNRTASFQGTRYEHFLASAVALASPFEYAAELGEAVSRGEIQACDVGIGRIIRDCVVEANAWQHGGNTLLGTSILLAPVAVAAGMAPAKDIVFDISQLRSDIKQVVEATTPEDAMNVYEAIRLANPGGLGKSSELDVNDPNSTNRIREERISLLRVFRIASSYDMICSEWVNNYPVTFNVAYQSLLRQLGNGETLDRAILHAFLQILEEYPDTLISRKAGTEKARGVSAMASEVLKLGFETFEGKRRLGAFDEHLRESSNLLNPGTTADIMAAALALCVLGGYRP